MMLSSSASSVGSLITQNEPNSQFINFKESQHTSEKKLVGNIQIIPVYVYRVKLSASREYQRVRDQRGAIIKAIKIMSSHH